MLTYQRSKIWSRQSCSQSANVDEGAFEALHFAVYEQLWLTYKLMKPTNKMFDVRCTMFDLATVPAVAYLFLS
jgi:hypothetical protein